jgi:Bifunctional DNA primase/polymerase, N-terminal
MNGTLLFSEIERKKQGQRQQIIEDLSWFRWQLLQNGYEPIPIQGKRPRIAGWTSGNIDLERIVRETILHLGDRSTGLRTGALVGVDIDLHNDDHAEIIRQVVEDAAGPTPFRRRGSKGAMLCYRKAGTPIGKLVIRDPAADRTLFEIFGEGGQFVAYGIHPDTGRPYEWLIPGQEPLLVPLAALPEISTDTLHDVRDRVSERLSELGYQVAAATSTIYAEPLQPGRIQDAETITQKFLDIIPAGAKRDRRGYINFPCPSCKHNDNRSGLLVTPTGGFRFHCFHASCDYATNTGWEPGGLIGPRVRQLYELMGGDPGELRVKRPLLKGCFDSLQDMLDQWNEARFDRTEDRRSEANKGEVQNG